MQGLPDDLPGFEAAARARLDPAVWAYLMAGADRGADPEDNVRAWNRLRLRPRVLRGVGDIDLSATVLGRRIAAPVLVAPTGRATRFHPDGEAAVLNGVKAAGSLALLPSSVAGSLAGLAEAAPRALRWQQVYFDADRGRMADLVARARAHGCDALVLTVDLVPSPHRSAPPPAPPKAAWEQPADGEARPLYAGVGLGDLAWLSGLGVLPVVVKGVLRADDAEACVAAGAAGIVVSNHGGAQLAQAIATADALAEVAAAVGGRAEVYVDGGVRGGAAVVKALALGARAVLVGRPAAWGLAVAGAEGVAAVMSALAAEIERTMRLCGVASCADVEASLVARR